MYTSGKLPTCVSWRATDSQRQQISLPLLQYSSRVAASYSFRALGSTAQHHAGDASNDQSAVVAEMIDNIASAAAQSKCYARIESYTVYA